MTLGRCAGREPELALAHRCAYRSASVSVVHRRRGAGWVAVIALAATLTAATHAAPDRRFDRSGIAFDYPSTWLVTTAPLSNATNPRYRFAVGTHRVRRTPRDLGPCLPGIASQLPPTAVLAFLREATGADRRKSLPRMEPRPKHFRLPTRGDSSLCGFGRGGRWIPFRAGGRALYLALYIGPRASRASRRTLGQLVDGMRIDPR
jgi:hypothetical protein